MSIIKIIGIIIMNIVSVILIIKNFRVAVINKRKLEAVQKCIFLFSYILGCIVYIAYLLLCAEDMNLMSTLLLIAMTQQYIAYIAVGKSV